MTLPLILFAAGFVSAFVGMNIAANAQSAAKKYGVPIKPGHIAFNWMQLSLIMVLKDASKKHKIFEKYYKQYLISCCVTFSCIFLYIFLIVKT